MSENEEFETIPPAPVETGIATVAPAQTGVLFSVTEETLKKLQQNALFRVTDIHDKAQVKELHTKRMEIVRARRSVDATRKTMNEPYQEIIKQNNALGKKLADTLEPLELALEKEEERVEAAIEAERVAKANALFAKRSEELQAIDMTMPEGLIRSSSDEVFEEHMMLLRAQAAERDRLEQQRKDQEAAAAELKRQQEAETARLQAEQEERDRLERERQEAAQKEADRLRQEEAENLRLEREDLDRQKEELRKQQEADAEELRLAREELDRLREEARKEKEDRERQQREAEGAAAKESEQPISPVSVEVAGVITGDSESEVAKSLESLSSSFVARPVDVEVESSVKPVAELSYAPSEGLANDCIPEPDLNQSVDAAFPYDATSPRLCHGGSDFNVSSPKFSDPSNTPEVEAKLANYTEQWLVQREFRMSQVRSIPFPMGMIDGMIDRITEQDAELLRLRRILAYVPEKTRAKAKEKAGYSDEVTAADAV